MFKFINWTNLDHHATMNLFTTGGGPILLEGHSRAAAAVVVGAKAVEIAVLRVAA